MDNFNDILAALDSANKKLEKLIYIPSLGQEVVARPLNAQHTKSLIKTTVDGPFAPNQFNIVIYGVLKDILDIDLSTINVYDKIVILLQLRAMAVSNELTVEFPDTDITKKINIDKHLKKFKKQLDMVEVKVEKDGITGFLNYASLADEYQFDTFLYQNQMSKVDQRDVNQMKTLVSPMFMSSVVMFLSSITIGEDVIDLRPRSVAERLKIADKLPLSFLLETMHQIDEAFGKNIQNILSVSTTQDGKTYDTTINIDAGFFLK